jgi:hypothetical protein
MNRSTSPGPAKVPAYKDKLFKDIGRIRNKAVVI